MTARPLHPRELLAQAAELSGRGAGRGRPRTVQLRAGISRACYAVFHDITSAAASMLVDGTATVPLPPHAFAVARWISHTDIHALAGAVTGRGNAALRDVLKGSPADLVDACEIFASLQDLRHQADYDHGLDVGRAQALGAVEEATRALELFSALRRRSNPHYLRFLRLAGGSVKIAKAR